VKAVVCRQLMMRGSGDPAVRFRNDGGRPVDALVVLQVERLIRRLEGAENGLCGTKGRSACRTADGFEAVDSGGFQHNVCGNFQHGEHVSGRGREHLAGGGELVAELLADLVHEGGFAGAVEVVCPRPGAGLDHQWGVVPHGADGVADDLGAAEQLNQGLEVMIDLGHLVLGRLDAGNQLHGLFDTRAIASCRDEGNLVVAHGLGHQATGVATGTVNNDGFLGHVDSPLGYPNGPAVRPGFCVGRPR
jgi:hypothetical protein